jgi:hypothetical protein
MVVVVEPDGRQGRQLISSDDGLNEPTGIYFDKSKNSLYISFAKIIILQDIVQLVYKIAHYL